MRTIRIVLAEDQAMIREAFAALLDGEDDIEVVGTAADGDEALELVTRLRPDVLVTDIEMPRGSGLDIAERLRAAGSGTRVMIVTTFGRSGYLRRALDAGVAGYVLKDAPIEHLAASLRSVERGRRVIDPELAVTLWESAAELTDRERDVLRLAEQGRPNREIAERLHLADGTVRNYLSTAIAKLGARNRTEAANRARELGLL